MLLAYFITSIKTNNYNKFDGVMQTNLSRDKVRITRGRGVRLVSTNFDNKNKSE